MFVGRIRELESLRRELERVRVGRSGVPHGRCLIVRGRRRVGKSRLIEEFCARENVPSIVFTASRQGPDEVRLFIDEVAQSSLPGRAVLSDANPTTWDAALRLLALVIDDDTPTVVVIDEFPYLVADDSTVEATFQKPLHRRRRI